MKKNGEKPDYLLFKNNLVYVINTNNYKVKIPKTDYGNWIGSIC